MLNTLVFQPPERCLPIEEARIREFTFDDLNKWMKQDFNLPDDTTYVANGVRAIDSPIRWAAVKKNGTVNRNKKTFLPVAEMRKAELVALLESEGVKLNVQYTLFSRSFDGIDRRFLLPIKQHFPKDYQKILDWFPLAELEVKRYEYESKQA